jgi:creatinine amidohydrolase
MDQFSTWPELENIDYAVVPIGSTEQHGHHLPINTDSIIAQALANRLGEKLNNSIVLPVLPFSASFEHAGFPGFVSLNASTIISVVKDIISSVERMGVKKTIIINGHGGNMLLGNIAQEMNIDKPRILVVPNRKHWDKAYEKSGLSTSLSNDMHAGEGETSLLMYLYKNDIVKLDKLVDSPSTNRTLFNVLGMKAYSKTGAIGFPSRASADKGKLLFEHLVSEIEKNVKGFIEL